MSGRARRIVGWGVWAMAAPLGALGLGALLADCDPASDFAVDLTGYAPDASDAALSSEGGVGAGGDASAANDQ
jgi:hypothetical protein